MQKNSKLLYLITGLCLAAFSGTVSAISAQCISVTQVSVPACAGQVVGCIDFLQRNHPECFGTTTNISPAMSVISKLIGARPAAGQSGSGSKKVADSGQHIGMAAGNSAAQWNFWGSVSSDKNKYDRGGFIANATPRNNTRSIDITNAVIGGDYQLNSTAVLGLSAAFDHSSGTGESFNTGASVGIANINSNGYTVAPYVGWQINQNLSLDASLGFGRAKSDTDGTTGKADRLFYGANLSYANWYGNWQMTGKGGYMHGEEKSGNLTSPVAGVLLGTEVTNKIDQLSFGARAGYGLNDSVMPYLGLTYSNDISRSTSLSAAAQLGSELGKNAFVWAFGVDFFSVGNSITGGISYNHETGRTYSKNNSLMANINFRY
ncbi:MAG: hypothetical protein A3H42_03360 [Deltaproteobacteria bacterium RIFCSPLOWO2_02_FULL_46_8]|nr:MAG: hypothetical protein A3H42_03360 [Deltaproteobacteria bacterium RIFCSPLOWO2_02_FULL_46_8]